LVVVCCFNWQVDICITQFLWLMKDKESYILNYPQPCILSVDLLFLMNYILLSFVNLDLDFTLSYIYCLILILYVASTVNVWGWLLCTNLVMLQWFSIIPLTVWPHNGNWIEGSSSPSMLLFCWGICIYSLLYFCLWRCSLPFFSLLHYLYFGLVVWQCSRCWRCNSGSWWLQLWWLSIKGKGLYQLLSCEVKTFFGMPNLLLL